MILSSLSKSLVRLAPILVLVPSTLFARPPIVLSGATLIDGIAKHPIRDAVIVIDRGMIVGAGGRGFVIIPPNAEVIDIRGKFIIPGLIDSHIHYGSPRDLLQLLAWGVTSANCMFESTDEGKAIEIQTLPDTSRSPRIFPVAPIFTAQHGWWGEGFPPDTAVNRFPKTPEEARAQIAKVKAKGISRIKLMYDGMGWCRDPLAPLEKMNPDVMRALIDEATRQNIFTEVHAPTFTEASEAQEAGVSAFVHGILDEHLSAPFVSAIPGKLEFYIPTFCLYEFLADVNGFVKKVLADERFRAALPDQTVREYTDSAYAKRYHDRYPNGTYVKNHLSILRENMMSVITNYGSVAMGTDMWAFPGIAAHLEMEYMVEAGLTPIQAIAVATTTGGQFLGSRVGIISNGLRADLLILDADPSENIRNTRTVRTIIKGGVFFDHEDLLKLSKQ